MQRVPGIRETSAFFRNFHGEDVIVRSAAANRQDFETEVLLTKNEVTFAPGAPVYEGDVIERNDPRGGVIEYTVVEYEISKDPFQHGNDHGKATIREKGREARPYGVPSVVIHGGTNQIAIGDHNRLGQHVSAPVGEVAAALTQILDSLPTQDLDGSQIAEVTEAIAEANAAESQGATPGALKRSLYAVRGVVEEVGTSARAGVSDAVKQWSASSVALILGLLSGS